MGRLSCDRQHFPVPFWDHGCASCGKQCGRLLHHSDNRQKVSFCHLSKSNLPIPTGLGKPRLAFWQLSHCCAPDRQQPLLSCSCVKPVVSCCFRFPSPQAALLAEASATSAQISLCVWGSGCVRACVRACVGLCVRESRREGGRGTRT